MTSKTETATRPPSEGLLALATWRNAVLLAVAVTALRIIYLVALCPYELVADEAQYWDWSRRLDLSYYSKGPGVAWAIRCSTELFGSPEWAIRLPAALSGLVAMLAAAAMARSMSAGSGRVAFLAVLAYCLMPAYHLTALLMTIDGPYIACWAFACWAFWEIIRARLAGREAPWFWLTLACAMGIGFLFKYTILLLAPGMIGFVLLKRASLRWTPLSALLLGAATVVFLALCAPVVIWNARNGWPTVAHLLGHLHAPGGDVPSVRSTGWSYNPMWTLSFVGSQLGVAGPLLVAMVIGWRGLRRRSRETGAADPANDLCLWLAAPILIFYFCVSLVTDAEGNWPIAGYITLLIPVARFGAMELPRHRALVRAWLADPARPRAGIFRRRPETWFQIAWDWSLGCGIVVGLGVLSLGTLHRLPLIGDLIPMRRLSGSREFAQSVAHVREQAQSAGGPLPFVMTDRYTHTALLAYYLPGRPSVRSAASLMGGRRSSYDFFADTRPEDETLLGRTAILVGARQEKWARAFAFTDVREAIAESDHRPPVFVGVGFAGKAAGDAAERRGGTP